MFTIGAVLCGLLSMFGYGLSNLFSQPLARKLGPAQLLFLRSFAIVAILTVGAAPHARLFLHYREVLTVFALGMAGYLPVLAFTHGIKISRIGVIAPIAGTAPLVTVLLTALILHSPVHVLQWVAIVAVVSANIALSVDLKNWRSSSIMQLSSGIPFALAAALGWGVFFLGMIYATQWLGPWVASLLVEAGVMAASFLHLLFTKQPIPFGQAATKPLMINGALICLGTVAYAIGVQRFNVSIVTALSNSTAVVAALVATYCFHEHLTRAEKIAGTVMVAGIVAITIF